MRGGGGGFIRIAEVGYVLHAARAQPLALGRAHDEAVHEHAVLHRAAELDAPRPERLERAADARVPPEQRSSGARRGTTGT